MSNSQLDKLKPGIKSHTEVTLNLLSNVTGDSNDETILHLRYYKFIHKFQDFKGFIQAGHKK